MRQNAITRLRYSVTAFFFLSCSTAWQLFADTAIQQAVYFGPGKIVRDATFAPNGDDIAVAVGADATPGEISLYSVLQKKVLHQLKGHEKGVDCLAYTVDGRLLLSGGRDCVTVIWNMTSRLKVGALKGHTDFITAVSVNPKRDIAATSSDDHFTFVWDLTKQEKLMSFPTPRAAVRRLAHSVDGKLLIGSAETHIYVWNLETAEQIAQWKAHDKSIKALAISPNGELLISCGQDNSVKIWETTNWTEIGAFSQAVDQPMSVAVSPDGNALATGWWSGYITFYNLSKTARRQQLPVDFVKISATFWGHNLPVTALSYNANGKTLATGSLDSRMKIWANLPQFK